MGKWFCIILLFNEIKNGFFDAPVAAHTSILHGLLRRCLTFLETKIPNLNSFDDDDSKRIQPPTVQDVRSRSCV